MRRRGSSGIGQSLKPRKNRRIAQKSPRTPRLRASLRAIVAKVVGPAKGRVLRAAGAALLGGGLMAGALVGWRALSRSPSFALEDVQVTGLSRASEEDIRALAGVELGDNLVSLDTEVIAKNVEKHPWVSRVHVVRRLPRGLTLEVVEHAPVALVALDHLYYVDAEGEVVKRLSPGEREALPVITGLSREEVESGDAQALPMIRAALGFLSAWERARPGQPLDEVHVGPSGNISVAARREGAGIRVHLGAAPYEAAIARYDAILAELEARLLEPSEILAMSARRPDRAVVRLASPAKLETNGKRKRN